MKWKCFLGLIFRNVIMTLLVKGFLSWNVPWQRLKSLSLQWRRRLCGWRIWIVFVSMAGIPTKVLDLVHWNCLRFWIVGAILGRVLLMFPSVRLSWIVWPIACVPMWVPPFYFVCIQRTDIRVAETSSSTIHRQLSPVRLSLEIQYLNVRGRLGAIRW
jgi:hypothetical protein